MKVSEKDAVGAGPTQEHINIPHPSFQQKVIGSVPSEQDDTMQ